ncbi:hypothetical protein AQUCO_00700511v1 [Aquilegia coerulea]|uniref:Uncharacterized protein n=1 Tax=Aquilegia coerulea TaxID=218851 RepID=A0A2G5EKD5_AQUCA|nr:hypothetical protein AQUCO_00700511v1 [Aquilegia coerulea]
MEESESRKLRLKAMRMEADEVEAIPNTSSSTESVHLSNPLTDPVLENVPVAAARFDYYSDPLASYTGNKRKSQKTYQNSVPPTTNASPGPANLNMHPSSCQQYNQTHSSDQRMYGPPMSHNSSGAWRSPNGMARPHPQQLGTPPATWNRPGVRDGYGFPPNSPMVGGFPPNSPMVGGFPPNSPMVGGFPPNSPMVGAFPPNSPMVGGFHPNAPMVDNFPPTVGGFPSPGFGPGRGSGYQINNTPYPNFGRGGSPNYNTGRSNISQFNNPIPGFGRGGSPGPNTGRSNQYGFNRNPSHGSGQGHGRNQGGHAFVSARERPERFYNRSMLEDPWRFLKPVVRRISMEGESSSTPGSSKSWLPKSISRKKDRVSDAVTGARSGFSLAETLAASYEEAAALAAPYEAAAATDDVKND